MKFIGEKNASLENAALTPDIGEILTNLRNILKTCDNATRSIQLGKQSPPASSEFGESSHLCSTRGGGRLKMREWKMQYGEKCKDGKCRSRLAVWLPCVIAPAFFTPASRIFSVPPPQRGGGSTSSRLGVLRPKNKSIESTAVFFVTLEQHPITLSELVADAPSRRSCAALHAA